MLSWTDLLIVSIGFSFVYKSLFPKQQPIVRLTPNELRKVLDIESKRRKEFSSQSWIIGQQEFPQVRGRLWQRERRLYVL